MLKPFYVRSPGKRVRQGRKPRGPERWPGGWTARWRRGWSLAFSREGAAGAALALSLAAALLLAGMLKNEDQDVAERERLQMAVNLAASVVQADLSRTLAAADTLETMLRLTGEVEPFEMAITELRQRFPLIRTVTLAPGGVVRQVSPSELAATFTGMRLTDDPSSRTEVSQAVRSRSMVVGLATDGRATYITGYQPVFRQPGNAKGNPNAIGLWGFVTINLKVPLLDQYLSAARLEPGDWLAELQGLDRSGSAWLQVSSGRLGDATPLVSARVLLPGRELRLNIASRQPGWRPRSAWPVALGAGCLLAGLVCTLALSRRRRIALRRQFFETSEILAGWTSEFDLAHAQLEALKRTEGLAVVAVVRMPTVGTYQRRGARVARGEERDWSKSILSIQRDGDLLVHLHGNDFLLAADSLGSKNLAMRIVERQQSQLEQLAKLACGEDTEPVFFKATIFETKDEDPGAVLARLLVALHAQERLLRRAAEAPIHPLPTLPDLG